MLVGTDTAALRSCDTSPYRSSAGNDCVARYTSTTRASASSNAFNLRWSRMTSPRRGRASHEASSSTQASSPKPHVRCAIYTRKSTSEGLESDFNTLDAQREAAEFYVRAMRGEGWEALPERYDDGGFTGANIERPALQR